MTRWIEIARRHTPDGSEYLYPDDVERILRDSPFMVTAHDDYGWRGMVYVSGSWRQLVRTDCMDHVVTCDPMNPKLGFKKTVFGAWMTHDYFAVIDRLTDG